jgi:hypothetical protein
MTEGLPGPAIDTGNDPVERRVILPRWVKAMVAAALVLAAFSLLFSALLFASGRQLSNQNSKIIDRIEAVQAQTAREGVDRRNQICLSDEREHLNAVERLDRTYRYLVRLTVKQFDEPINSAIFQQLPDLEDEAMTDQAPDFCDEPGEEQEKLWRQSGGERGAPPVGLPEPDPDVPQRPAGIPPVS